MTSEVHVGIRALCEYEPKGSIEAACREGQNPSAFMARELVCVCVCVGWVCVGWVGA